MSSKSPEKTRVGRPEFLFERLASVRCNMLITSGFLFKWKTSL